MKKFRCPKCGEVFQGELEVCPNCQTKMHYRRKIKENPDTDAKIVQRFNFDDPDIIKHEEKNVETPLVEKEEEQEQQETKPVSVSKEPLVSGDSFYDGRFFPMLGLYIVAGLMSVFSIGIAVPWAVTMVIRYQIKHTYIQGHRLAFDGKGGQLFGRWMLWMLLSIFTLFIFALWIPLFFRRWKIKHIIFAD